MLCEKEYFIGVFWLFWVEKTHFFHVCQQIVIILMSFFMSFICFCWKEQGLYVKVINTLGKCALSTDRYTGRTVNQSYGKGVLQYSIDIALKAILPLISEENL